MDRDGRLKENQRKLCMQHPIPVPLSETDHASLQTFIHAAKPTRAPLHVHMPCGTAADGWTAEQICEALGITRNTSMRVRQASLSPRIGGGLAR